MRITVLLSLLLTRASSLRRVAVVTGGTRGIGRGISEALAEHDFDLLVSYNSDEVAAEQAAGELKTKYNCAVACVGGDVSLPETRAKIWETFDKCTATRTRWVLSCTTQGSTSASLPRTRPA